MDIGTAKPTLEERRRVPHYGLDVAQAAEGYSVAEYIRYRDSVLDRMRSEGRPVVVCGGSGFYLKSFFANVVDTVQIPDEIEAQVCGLLQGENGLARATEALKRCHSASERFPGLDWNNPRRVGRALVRCLASGKPYSALKEAFEQLPEPLQDWRKTVRVITRPEASMEARNRERVGQMLVDGLVEEVKRLREEGFEANPMASGSVGYAETLQYLDGHLTREEMEARIVVRTRQLMRKQRNWFRHHLPSGEAVEMP
jgi:tRNA dimethylallyltransferase